MPKPSIIGIDPGKNGGIAAALPSGDFYLNAMPETIEAKIQAIKHLSLSLSVINVYIEQVHAMPRDGKGNIFTFARHTGELIGICKTLGLEVIEVSPQKWQNKLLRWDGMKPEKGKSKEKALKFCQEVLKIESRRFYLSQRHSKMHDGMADAACIAYYGQVYGAK